jgi:tetratricopeptide (TPR) repeat protein
MALSLVVEALGLVSDGWRLYRNRKQAHVDKLDRLLDEARAASGPEANALLAQVCEEAARRVEKKPQDAHALHQWGVALWWRATKASPSEADHIYEQADQKFVQSQAIAPNDGACCADRVGAMVYRAALHTGDKGRRLRLQICELCRKRVGVMWSGPYDGRTFRAWGSALWWLAASETGAETKRLYKEAAEKFEKAVSLAPDETDFAVERAQVSVYRAALHTGDEQREMLERVCQQCQQLAQRGKGGARMLEVWSGALCWLGSAAKGDEAARFYAEAEKIAARALRIDPDSERAAVGLARTLTCRALEQRGEVRRRLLDQVCERCARFEKAHPRDADQLLEWGTALLLLASIANRT